jgi:hypothetical protein
MYKQHILDEIKRIAASNGGVAPGRAKFLSETGIRESDWMGKYWVRWNDALREAGFAPNQMQGAYKDEELLERLGSFIRELGSYPIRGELLLKARNDSSFPNEKTFRRLGSKKELAAMIIARYGDRPGYEDVM